MEGEIKYKGKTVAYNIKRSDKAKRLRVAVYCGGAVEVIAPYGFDQNKIQVFLKMKIDWILEKVGLLAKVRNSDLMNTSRKHYLNHKKQALHLARKKVEKWNEFFNFDYNELQIKNHKTKWGSCSVKKNLNFNYKIIFLSEELQDYIIVHELCHLKEMNHSPKFWALVRSALPDCEERKKKFTNI
ncbi:MAG: M48 family metallopeptidase [Candidatus Magasanikbacteria bacterium]|jgi:predicted metal-dependent hydrolase|nr:M48 family metallopeptidase [Candidatus Magasanikbacteria bacterium]